MAIGHLLKVVQPVDVDLVHYPLWVPTLNTTPEEGQALAAKLDTAWADAITQLQTLDPHLTRDWTIAYTYKKFRDCYDCDILTRLQ